MGYSIMMPRVKARYNKHYISDMRLVVFSKYTMEVMNKSTLFNKNMFKNKQINNIHVVYRKYTRVE